MYETILLPYDGTEGADAVLDHACEIARWADATIHLLYVADTTRDSVTVIDGGVVDVLERKGERLLGAAADRLKAADIDHNIHIVQGNPAPTIVEYTEQSNLDLLVMPTHGREGVSRYLNGSVSEKVVRLSSRPVLTVRLQSNETLAFPYQRILIPTDGSETAADAAAHTLSLAAALDATVHVLSVVDDTGLDQNLRSAVSRRDSETEATAAIEAVVAEADTRGIDDTVQRVEHGSPTEQIREYVESNSIHAIGMGTTGRRGTDRILLGSVAENTVRSAPVPVLTLGE